MELANTLAYYDMATTKAVKRFIELTPDFLAKNVYNIDAVFQHHRRGSRRNADGVARRGLLPVGRHLQRQGPDP